MRHPIKYLLAAGIGAFLTHPALGQTTTTTTAQNPSTVQLAPNNPGVAAAQALTNAQFNRLFGGLSAAVMANANAVPGTAMNGILPTQGGSLQPGVGNAGLGAPPAPGVVVPGSATAGISSAQQANNAFINQIGVNSAVSTAPVQTGTGPTTAIPGVNPAQTPGVAQPGMVNNFPGTSSTGINVPQWTFVPGSGLPGTGMSTPGTIVQSAGQSTIQNARIAAPQFSRVFGGLTVTQFPQSSITTRSGFKTLTPMPTTGVNPGGTTGRPGGR
jgi:hypothetical protein